jgi:hypothetical protein
MRKLLISLLLASAAATPALAARPDFTDRQQAREDRQQAREDARSERQAEPAQSNNNRPERGERAAEPRPQNFQRPQNYVAPAGGQFAGGANARDVEALRAQRDARLQALQAGRQGRVEQRQERLQDLRDNRALRQAGRPPISRDPRPGTQPPPPVVPRPVAQPNWSTNWRHNSKYDWYNWRNRHRSLFHFGFYYDPFGWGYSPFQIGWRMWPGYYSSSFWLNDPWQYRLPYAPPGTRWIRYYDDAILVDTWNGQVVDVIYNFFW